MEKRYRRCCGMDVHKETVVVCVLPPDTEEGKALKKVYCTFRNDLGRMRGWLKQLKLDKKLIITAAGAGQKAADWILGERG